MEVSHGCPKPRFSTPLHSPVLVRQNFPACPRNIFTLPGRVYERGASVGFELFHRPAGRFLDECPDHGALSTREKGSTGTQCGGGARRVLPPRQERPLPLHREASGQAGTTGHKGQRGGSAPTPTDGEARPKWARSSLGLQICVPRARGGKNARQEGPPPPQQRQQHLRRRLSGSEAMPRQQSGRVPVVPWETSHLCPSVFLHPWNPGAVEATWI